MYNCDLCTKRIIALGKGILLHDGPNYYILENSNTDGYTRRISIVPLEHGPGNDKILEWYSLLLSSFMVLKLGIPGDKFVIMKTMRTYPEHFHLHAYILPKLYAEEAAFE